MKRKKTSLLVISSIVSSSLVVGYSSWIVSSVDFSGGEITKASSGPIAYNSKTLTKYTNLKTALDKANSGDSIIVYIGSTITCNETLIVKSGVSLILPFAGKAYDSSLTGLNISDTTLYKIASADDETEWGNTLGDSSSSNVRTYRSILLNMRKGADIIVNGTLSVGGVHGSKGNNGYFSEINLGAKSSITCKDGSVFNCFGYIKEDSKDYANLSQKENSVVRDNSYDKDRYVYVSSGATLYTYLAMYDAQSAGTLTGLVAAGQTPFQTFDFQALQTYVSFEYGSKMYANALLTGPNSMKIDKQLIILSSLTSDSALFYMSSGNFNMENCPSNVLYSSRTIGNAKTYYTFDCNVSIGYLHAKEGIGSYTFEMDTRDTFLPLSCRSDLAVIKNHTFKTDYKLKFLLGSSMYVEEGSTFEVNNQVAFYNNDVALAYNGQDNIIYNYTGDDAYLVNNGTLTFNTDGKSNAAFGGLVTHSSTSNKGKVDLSNLTSDSALSVTSPEGTTDKSVTVTFQGYYLNGEVIEKRNFLKQNIYTSSYSNSNYYWSGNFLQTYYIKISVVDGIENPVLSYDLLTASSPDGTNSSSLVSGGNSSSSYALNEGTYFSLNITRTNIYSIKDDAGNELNLALNTYSKLSKNINVTITPKKGNHVYINYAKGGDGTNEEWMKGTGHIDYFVYESPTQNGTYYQVAKFSPTSSPNLTTYGLVAENYYFKIQWAMRDEQFASTYYNGYDQDMAITTNPSSFSPQPTTSYNPYSTSNKKTGKFDSTYKYDVPYGATSGAFLSGADYTFTYYWYFACFVKGTLISMADGSFRKIEELKPGELILSYDFETGKYISTPVAEVTNHGENVYDVLRLHFDDESSIGIIQGHGFFDVTLKKYVDIDENNYKQYIGHEFMKCIDGRTTIAKLVTGEISVEKTCSYSLLAAVTINAIADGFVTITPPITDWYNMFEVGDDLKWDEEKKREDIEKYGLFEYDEVKDIVPYEIYVASNFKYYKVAFAKGLLTMEDVKRFLEWYRSLERNGEIKLGI